MANDANTLIKSTEKLLFSGRETKLAISLYLLSLQQHTATQNVVVVCPLQPSSSVNSGCPGPESSILVSYRWACPISSQVTDHWGELRNRTGEV